MPELRHCGAAGSYHRHFDDCAGERRVRVERMRCLSCKKTHALIWMQLIVSFAIVDASD